MFIEVAQLHIFLTNARQFWNFALTNPLVSLRQHQMETKSANGYKIMVISPSN